MREYFLNKALACVRGMRARWHARVRACVRLERNVAPNRAPDSILFGENWIRRAVSSHLATDAMQGHSIASWNAAMEWRNDAHHCARGSDSAFSPERAAAAAAAAAVAGPITVPVARPMRCVNEREDIYVYIHI
jgi:phage tail sheath gpL-like